MKSFRDTGENFCTDLPLSRKKKPEFFFFLVFFFVFVFLIGGRGLVPAPDRHWQIWLIDAKQYFFCYNKDQTALTNPHAEVVGLASRQLRNGRGQLCPAYRTTWLWGEGGGDCDNWSSAGLSPPCCCSCEESWPLASVLSTMLVALSVKEELETWEVRCSMVTAELGTGVWRFLMVRSEVMSKEVRSFTGQNADPVGLKLTLFLSGHERRAIGTGWRDDISSKTFTRSHPSGGSRLNM